MIVHCLFEQSGTFKNEFKKLGYEAYDYDIQNEFGGTDKVIDLFEEISKAYDGKQSIFDNINKDDLILAFYPCTYFSDQAKRHLDCTAYQYRNYTIEQKCEVTMKRHRELSLFYETLNKMVIVFKRKKLKAVIENPVNPQHYLTQYWCLKPDIIDRDRRENGDYFKKPTQYWFINCEAKSNLVLEPLEQVATMPEIQRITTNNPLKVDRKTMRSMIHPQYASRFIRQYLIEPKEQKWKK